MENTLTQSPLLNNSQDLNRTGAENEGSGIGSMKYMSAIAIIWSVFPPILIVLGSIGNVLIIAVLFHYANTTGTLFRALAAADLVGLYVSLFPFWLMHLSWIDFRNSGGNFACKVMPWISVSILEYSAWILVAVTVERVIAACFPHKIHTICSRRCAVGYLIVIGLILLCVNAHLLFGYETIEIYIPGNGIQSYCTETSEGYTQFVYRVLPWIDLTVYCLLPFIVICVGNCIILLRVRSSYQRSVRKRSLSVGANNTSTPLASRRRKKRISNLTVTLLLVNSAFFVSTVPISVFRLARILSEEYFQDNQNQGKILMWMAFVYNFMFLNNTCNVFLYCLSGSKFREGALALFRRIRKLRVNTSSESFRTRPSGSDRSSDKYSKDTKTPLSTTGTRQTRGTEEEDEL